MSITKTLGGDRLGSGKKMKVELHNYERSTHDLSYVWRSTMAAGTLVPFLNEVALPGDTFDIDLDADVKTHPTIGPLFGSYKVQLDVFQAPIRLYNSLLHNNELGIGLDMSKVKLPVQQFVIQPFTTVPEDIDNSQINPSCLLSYLGLRGFGNPGTLTVQTVRAFNAVPTLAYWDIYKNYYANKQEEVGVAIHTPYAGPSVDVITITAFPDPNNSAYAITINKAPSIQGAPFDVDGGYIEVSVDPTTGIFRPEGIMFYLWDGRVLSMSELCYDIQDVTVPPANPTFRGYVRVNELGPLSVKNWNDRTSQQPYQGPPILAGFPLENIDIMRRNILSFNSTTTPFIIDSTSPEPYRWLSDAPTNINNTLSSQEGLGVKTYQSDLFNNWLQTEWIDGPSGIAAVTAIDTSSGSFTLDTLLLSRKVYDMLNRIAVAGGSYDDWLDAVYAHPRYTRCESPIYCGGLSKELMFQEVVSNSQTVDQPLGTLAGKGVLTNKHKGGKVTIKVDEPSYIIGIISLTPRLDYSQGNKWDTGLLTLDDLHKPALDEIGFQDLVTEQMAWWDTVHNGSVFVQKSAGKQPAWMNYMTNVNQVRGNFAVPVIPGATNGGEMFMTLNRKYEYNNSTKTIQDLTSYIDPSKYNQIFAQTALDAQNFWTQIGVNITARRKMSAKVMPNL